MQNGADPDSVLLCQCLPLLVVMMIMFYTRPCSNPISLPNKDYIGTNGEQRLEGHMAVGRRRAAQRQVYVVSWGETIELETG